MRFQLEGAANDPVVVLQSGFWSFNAIGFFDGDEACVVDPGIEPREIEALSARLDARGARVTHVVITHSHHDHIRGWMRFPGAEIWMPAVAAGKEEGPRTRILAAKRAIDQRLGVEDPQFRYPEPTRVFDQRASFRVGALEVELRFLPGHSNCTSVVWVPALGTLCTADYLVSPGLPYCRWRAREFEEALDTMEDWVDADGVERVLPAHNDLLVGRATVLDALATERAYFQALRADCSAGLTEGLSREAAARRAAARAGERRGVDLGKRARQDLDNAQRVVAEGTTP